ncbi:MAG TPA: hypothetical protein VFP91_15075 [Vicinamibacterales bacterium]|nr:hypothetical protein [Vicinamibacterales bacterium]
MPTFLSVLFLCSTLVAVEVPATFAPFEFLLGRWIGIGDQASATGGFSFALDLQNHVIVRTNYSNTPATASQPASRHDDLMVIYVEGAETKAVYFDSEGHVIRYQLHTTRDVVVFVSDAKTAEPRYRLTYRRGTAAATLDGTFEIAPPGKPDAFAPYLSWRARKTK